MFGGPEAEPQWDGAALSKETTLECFMEVGLRALSADEREVRNDNHMLTATRASSGLYCCVTGI